MGRPAKVIKAKKAVSKGDKPRGRAAAPKQAPTRMKAAVYKAVKPKPAAAPRQAVSRPSPISKDELRAQLQKLEQENGILRTKARDARRAEKLAGGRIAELELQVSRLEKHAGGASEDTHKPKVSKAAGKPRSQDRTPIKGSSDLPNDDEATVDEAAAD